MSDWVQDVGEDTFERDVIARSHSVPVVVDFWAPWCGPCRLLGPLLERLIDEKPGEFALAKVNVDDNPRLAATFGAQSIPLVVGIRGGRVVGEFVGALPEPQVRAFLASLVPSEAERLAQEGEEKAASGAGSEAETLFRQALEKDPRSPEALLGLAKLLAEQGRDAEALQLIEKIPPGSTVENAAERLAAAIRVRGAADGDADALRARLAGNPDDLETRFSLAQLEAAQGHYRQALDHFLEIIRRNRSFHDDGARKAMLDIFGLLGPGDELADRYRSELAKVLFS